ALVIATRDQGYPLRKIVYQHGVERYTSALLRVFRGERDVRKTVFAFLDAETRAGIRSLDSLVPQAAEPSGEPVRNTEYPFRDAAGQWTFPAADDTFDDTEVKRFRDLSYRIVMNVGKIMAALRRKPTR